MVRIMHIKWFSPVRYFNWRLTQLNWLVFDRLLWEVEVRIAGCHTRVRRRPAVGVAGRRQRTNVALILPLNFHHEGVTKIGDLDCRSFSCNASPTPTCILASAGLLASSPLTCIYRELRLQLIFFRIHITYSAAWEFPRSISCAHTR
jgi:hypothetical protein